MVYFVAVILVILTTLIHLLMFYLLFDLMLKPTGAPRPRIWAMVLIAILIHLLEIGLYAGGIYYLAQTSEHGGLSGITDFSFGDVFYYSATVYTTLGFGDITPLGDLRVLAAIESLNGLVLSAWTASALFLAMQRNWEFRRKKQDA